VHEAVLRMVQILKEDVMNLLDRINEEAKEGMHLLGEHVF